MRGRKSKTPISTTSKSALILLILKPSFDEVVLSVLWHDGQPEWDSRSPLSYGFHQLPLDTTLGVFLWREQSSRKESRKPGNTIYMDSRTVWRARAQKGHEIELLDVVDIGAFNFRRHAPIPRKTEKWQNSQSRRWDVFRF